MYVGGIAESHQMEMASTGIKGSGREPTITTSTIKYQNSKLHRHMQTCQINDMKEAH